MRDVIDAAEAATTPFEGTPHHELLARMVGRWSGPTRTWFEPGATPEECTSEVSIESVLGGRFVRITSSGRVMDRPHAGEMLVGFHRDLEQYEIAWADSFHTGTSLMLSTGAPQPGGAISVLGSYPAGDERWGWRTVLRLSGPDALLLEAFNITPAGDEMRAIETRLRRR
jgi:hypothetical protein